MSSDKENKLKPVSLISADQSKKLFDLVAPDLGLNNYEAFHEKLADENLAKQFLGVLNDRYENSFGDFDQFYSQLKKKDAPDLTAGYLKFDFASPKPSEQPDPGLSLDTVDEKIAALDKLNEGLRREWEADYGSLVPGLGEQFARKELDRKWEKSEALKNYDTQRKELLSQKLAEVGITPELITAKMAELQDQLQQAKYDLSKSNLTGAELMVASAGAKDPFDQEGQNLEMRAELARKTLETKKKTQSAIEFLKLADKLIDPAQQREGLAALTKGLGSVLLKDFMTAGISEIGRMIDVKDVSKKMEKGEPVSEEEKNLMEAYGILSEIEKDPSRSISAGVGRGVSSMIPYIMQFAITNGAAAPVRALVTKAMTKGIAKEGIGMVSKSALLAGKITTPVAKLTGTVAGAVVQTPLMPMAYVDLNRRLAGEVTKGGDVVDGSRESVGEAIKNAGLTSFSEVFTEKLGELAVSPLIKGIRGKLKLAPSRIPNRIEKATAFDGVIPEYAEEVVNSYLQPALTGDKKLSEVWNNKEQLTTLLTVGIVGGGYYGINKASTGIDNAALARLYRIDDDTKEKVNSVLKKSTTTEMATELANLFKSGEYSPSEIIDITKYTMGRLTRLVGAESAQVVGETAAEEMKKEPVQVEPVETKVVEEAPAERAAPMEPIPPKPAELVREIPPSDQSKIALLALRISEGEQITKPEDLDLQQTYPAELEAALTELKPKEKVKSDTELRIERIRENGRDLDEKIIRAQTNLGLPETPDVLISDDTEITLEKLDNNEPVTNEFIKKAQDELYERYKELEKSKGADTRLYTIEQIESMQEFIGEEITKLEDYARQQKETGEFVDQAKIGEIAEVGAGEVIEPVNQEVVEPVIVKTTQVGEVGKVEKSVAEPQKLEPESVAKEQKRIPIQTQSPDRSKKLETDADGNVVFYHVSPDDITEVDPTKAGKAKHGKTSAKELRDMTGAPQGFFYINQSDIESGISGQLYQTKVKPDEVYYLQKDPENFYDEAKRRFHEIKPGQAFEPNAQMAFIMQVAAEHGYKIGIADWGKTMRAQTAIPIPVAKVKDEIAGEEEPIPQPKPPVTPKLVGEMTKKEQEDNRRSESWMKGAINELPNQPIDRAGIEKMIASGKFSMLTAENPNNVFPGEGVNRIANEKAKQWLIDRGYTPMEIAGRYDGRGEHSFLVEGMSVADAIEFAKTFNQESIATESGMYYQDGSFNPRVPGGDNVKANPEFIDNYYSVIRTKSGASISIKVGYDFETQKTKKNAKRAGGKTETTGRIKGTEGGKEERIRVRDLEENGVEAEPGKKIEPITAKPTGTLIFQDLQAKIESIKPGENTTDVTREVGRNKNKLKPSEYSGLLDQIKPKQEAYVAEQIRLQKVRSGLVSSALKKFSQAELSDQVEKTKKALRDSMGTATMGFDPKALIELAKLTRMYVQNGVVDFVDFVKQIQGVWGDGFSKIEPFLADMWEQVTGNKPTKPKAPDNSGKRYAEGGQKARLTVSNTLMNAGGSLAEEASRQIALGTIIAMYDPQNTEEASGLAMRLIETLGGIEAATPTLIRRTGSLSELPINQVARAIAIQYYSEVIENPKTSRERSEEASKTRLDLIGIMAEEATFSGRANAFLQNFNSMTPAGLVIDYQNRINITARQAAARDKNFQEEARLFEDAVKNLPELVERLVNENKELRDRIKAAEQRAITKRENVYRERAKKEAHFRDEFIKNIDRAKLIPLTSGGINPYLIEVIGKLGASYVRQGVLEMAAIAQEVKNFLKSNDIDLPDQDILDALEASTVKQEAEIESQSDRAKKIAGKAKAGQIRDIVKASLQNQGNLKDKLVKGLMEDAGFVREDATELAAEIETIITAKVEVLSESIVRKQLTPKEKVGTPMATKMRTKVDQLLDMVKMGAFDKRDLIPLFKEKWGLRDMTDEEMEKIKEYGAALSKMLPGTIKNKTVIEFTDFMSNIIKKDKWNRFADTWIELNYLSMLSGVSTAIVNTIGPAMSLVFRPLAGMTNVGKWFNAARKAKKDGKFDIDTFRAENPMLNVLLYVNSVIFGFKQGGKAWTDIMEHGVSDSKFIETRKRSRVLDVPETERHAFKRSWRGALTAPVRWITRNLSAMDMLITTTIFESQMAGMLQKERLNGKTYKGWKNVMDELVGHNLDAEVISGIRDIAASEAEEFQKVTGRPMRQREIDMRIRELIIDNIDPLRENSEMANAIARDNVFRNKRWGLFGHLAHSIGMVTNSSRIAKIATLPHIPFLEIVANVLDYMIDYTPLYGLVRPTWSLDRLIPSWSGKNAQLGEKGSDLYYEQLARGYFGTIAFFTLLAMTVGDGDDEDWDQNSIIVTGPMTKWGDKYTKKDQWLKPYSIHFRKKDGTYWDVNYLYIPQLAIPLGIIGELNDRIHTDKNPTGAEQWFKTVVASTNVVPQLMMDMSFVDGVNRLADLVTQLFAKIEAGESVSDDAFKYLAKSYLGLVTNPLPQNWNIFNQIEKSIWPESRSKKSIEEILKASVGLHYANNKIVDIFGNPIKSYPGERQFDWPNWFGLTQTDPRYRFLIENNAIPQSMKNQALTFYYGTNKTTIRPYTPDEYLEVATNAGKYFAIYVDNLMKAYTDDDVARIKIPALVGEKQKTLVQKSVADAWSQAKAKAKEDFMMNYRVSDRARKELDEYLKQFVEK